MRRWVRGVAAAVAAVALAGCWPAPGQGPDGTGFNPFETRLTIDNVSTLATEWEVAAGASNLVAADGVLMAGVGGGLTAYDIATGAPVWTKPPPGHRYASYRPAVLHGGAAYVPLTLVGTDTHVYDLQTGQSLPDDGVFGGVVAFRGDDVLLEDARPDPSFTVGIWNFLVLDEAGSQWGGVTHIQPPFANEVVNTTLGIDRVYSSGYGLMSTTPGDGTSGVGVRAFGPELPATCGPVDNPVYACPHWVTPIDGALTTPVVIGPGGATLYVATDAGTVYAIDAATGAVRWSAVLGAPIIARPALAEGSLYVPLSTGDVQVLPTDGCGSPTCSPVWTAATSGIVKSQPAVAGGVVYVGTDTGSVLAFAAAGCGAVTCPPVWTFAMGSPVTTAPIVTGGRLIVGAGARLVSLRPTPPPAADGP